jgi:acetylornithine deacetylase/succinyl-diaminopimelate desuccinylase-like protein
MNQPLDEVRRRVQSNRLLDLARRLVAIPSPTGRAGDVLASLAAYLIDEGFSLDRPAAGHPEAPAVVARLTADRPGRTLHWDGHLDTVHLPFVPDRVAGSRLLGSGASDMKAGFAAAVEALLALRDGGLLSAGTVLLTAHDLHEAPWGRGEQFDQMVRDGVVGDAVMIPEPLCDDLPIVGRGQAWWKLTFRRAGLPVHEVMRSRQEPEVIRAGAMLVQDLARLEERLRRQSGPMGLSPSVFVGLIHCGEIYNQFPQECVLEGTRRWLPGTTCDEVEHEFREIVAECCRATGATAELEFRQVRDAFALDTGHKVVSDFQASLRDVTGASLKLGVKPFVDDGNSAWALKKVPAITHGPRAGGQHTVHEWVEIDDLTRVAVVYAMTAIRFCAGVADGEAS